MHLRILDLDGSLLRQREALADFDMEVVNAVDWGPHIRLACSHGRFRRFEGELARRAVQPEDSPALTLCGSGDFHHVSLALIRRLRSPINLLVLDNHPDWMRGVPFMHCGTWLYHAARLPQVARIFHVGGDVDFDNYYQSMAPWSMLRAGKIVVWPARRRFERGPWAALGQPPIAPKEIPFSEDRLYERIAPYREELASMPLYISLDKDVMNQGEALVNWDSGHLALTDVQSILRVFDEATGRNLAGMDIVGDWSPVRLRGTLRHFMHWSEHPPLIIDSTEATRCNASTNRTILETILQRAAA